MTRLLFVDDEPMVLRSLQRTLRMQRPAWDVEFVPSGAAALATLALAPVDVIVSDIGMPELDGVSLLTAVRDRFPAVVRLALSGDAQEATRVRAVSVVHQWFAKPFPIARLIAVLERIERARAPVGADALAQIGRASALAVPTASLAALTTALEGVPRVDELVAIVAASPGLTAKLFQLTSSAFLGDAHDFTELRDALQSLGTPRLRQLVALPALWAAPATTQDLAARAALLTMWGLPDALVESLSRAP